MVRFPITAQSVIQSRRRQTAYDGLERLTRDQRLALGFDVGPSGYMDDDDNDTRSPLAAPRAS